MDSDPNGIQRPSLRRLNVSSGSSQAGGWQQSQPSPAQAPAAAAPPVAGQKSGIDRDILLTGAGCVLILFAGLLIAGIFALRVVGNKPTPVPPTVPVVAVAPTATDTPMPTETPTPTEVSPYTPLPTWTPMGNKPQVNDYRGHDAEYRDDINGLGDFMKQSIGDVNALLQKPDPTNQNWQYKIVTQIDVWQGYFYEVESSIPPDQYQNFNQNLLKALSHLKTAADDIDYALEFNEPARLDQAKKEIATGAPMLDSALASLRASA
jgi:hypothetical protein